MAKSKNNNGAKSNKKDKKSKPSGLTSNATESPGIDGKYYPKANPETVL